MYIINKHMIGNGNESTSNLDLSKNEVSLSESYFKVYSDVSVFSKKNNNQLKIVDNHISSNNQIRVGKRSTRFDSGIFEREVKLNINMLLDLLRSEDYIEGEITKCQLFLESLYTKESHVFSEVFQQAWLRLYNDSYELRKYLCIASSLDYEILKDKADVLILGGASHKDYLVNEASLRAAEAWSDPRFLTYLKGIREFEFDWLNDYKKSVIDYLEHL